MEASTLVRFSPCEKGYAVDKIASAIPARCFFWFGALESEMDRTLGANLVQVKSIGVDSSPFKLQRDPGNPAADQDGMVKMPNVDVLMELADMREANRSYEANLQVAKQSADMLNTAIGLMKDA